MPSNAAFLVERKGSLSPPSILFLPAVIAAIIPSWKAHNSLATTMANGESVYGNSLTPSRLFGIALLLFCVSGMLIWIARLMDVESKAWRTEGEGQSGQANCPSSCH